MAKASQLLASYEKRETLIGVVARTAEEVSTIPFTVGGGASSLEDIEAVLKAGASKVSKGSQPSSTPSSSGRPPAYLGLRA
jgi:cyclase